MADYHPVPFTVAGCKAIVFLASLLVPRNRRGAWRREWFGEIWHWCYFLSETNRLNTETKLEVIKRCWGAFADAAWYRFNQDEISGCSKEFFASPLACLSVAGGSFIGVALLCLVCLGPVESAPIPHGLWTAGLDSNVTNRFSPLDSDDFLRLASAWSRSNLLSGTAMYSWAPSDAATPKRRLSILAARVAPEFFELVKVRPVLGRAFNRTGARRCLTCVLISTNLWRLQYDHDPAVIGRTLTLRGGQYTIVGVLPRGIDVFVPGIDAWLLFDPNGPPFRNYMERFGAVIRLGDAPPQQVESDLNKMSDLSFLCCVKTKIRISSIQQDARREMYSGLTFLLMAVGGVVATVLVNQAGPLFAMQEVPKSLWWWAFFAAKTALAVATSYLSSLLLVRQIAIWLTGTVYPVSSQLSIWLFISVAVLVLSLCIHDQRFRCRRCLRLLQMPVHIGRVGSPLLDRAGSEMACPLGHGVLYCPASQLTPERDRWTAFDDSWRQLFLPN
jgi:MacB-like periplasmic core domain